MKATLRQLRQLVQEEREYVTAINELFGGKPDFGKMMDAIMQDLMDATKKVEKAHQFAPAGAGKAIVAGLHSDLFNKVAEFREYVNKLKGMARQPKAESRLREAAMTKAGAMLTKKMDAALALTKKAQALSDQAGYDPRRGGLDPKVAPKLAIDLYKAHEAAFEAWLDVNDTVNDAGLGADSAERNRHWGPDVHERYLQIMLQHRDSERDIVDDLQYDVEELAKREADQAAGAAALKKKGLKPVTEADLEKVYRAALSEYSSSYSMMVDDAMKGADSMAQKLGLSVLTDWGWFPLMFRYIRNHRRWDAVSAADRAEMVDFANEELVRWGKKPDARKKKRGS